MAQSSRDAAKEGVVMRNPPSVLLSVAVVLASASAARAQVVTAKEFVCMAKTTAAEAKFVFSKGRCVSKCFYDVWHSSVNSSDAGCRPPYGGATAQCINDTVLGLKGAENKFSAAIQKACVLSTGADCPECYDGGDCGVNGVAGERVSQAESEVGCSRSSPSMSARSTSATRSVPLSPRRA
jgi:hypothetical protein